MRRIKSYIVHVLDKIDNLIFKHRFYWLCELVSIKLESWWGDDCNCEHCSDLKKYAPRIDFDEWAKDGKEKEED